MKRGAGRRRKRKRRVVVPPAISEIEDYKEAWKEVLLKLLKSLEKDNAPRCYIEAVKEVLKELEKISVQTRLF